MFPPCVHLGLMELKLIGLSRDLVGMFSRTRKVEEHLSITIACLNEKQIDRQFAVMDVADVERW